MAKPCTNNPLQSRSARVAIVSFTGLIAVSLTFLSAAVDRNPSQRNGTSHNTRQLAQARVSFTAPEPVKAPAAPTTSASAPHIPVNAPAPADEIDLEAELASDTIAAMPMSPVSNDAGMELLHDMSPAQTKQEVRRVLRLEVTAYCPCPRCCGAKAKGITASGMPITHGGGAFVAADTTLLPFGTRLQIPGYNVGRPVEVIDRGGRIKGHHIDVFFPTHDRALQWGRRWLDVTVD